MRMVKQKSSYLSDFECDSDDEIESSVREVLEMEHFTKNVELDHGRAAATPDGNEERYGAAS